MLLKVFLALYAVKLLIVVSGHTVSKELQGIITIEGTFNTYKENMSGIDDEEHTYYSSRRSVEVPDPSIKSCREELDCVKYSLELTCVDGFCECRDACWVYHYIVDGFKAKYIYECGECGILGSECNSTLPCKEPGHCSSKDNFCHCPEGEHREQICFIVETPVVTGLLFGGLLVFLILGICVALYNAYQGYQLYGTCCWCRYVGVGVRTTQVSRGMGPAKSPAYTMEPQPVSQASLENNPVGATPTGEFGVEATTQQQEMDNPRPDNSGGLSQWGTPELGMETHLSQQNERGGMRLASSSSASNVQDGHSFQDMSMQRNIHLGPSSEKSEEFSETML